jgi:hypothetical protein
VGVVLMVLGIALFGFLGRISYIVLRRAPRVGEDRSEARRTSRAPETIEPAFIWTERKRGSGR